MDLPTTMTIDGFGPLPVVRPSSIAEVGDVVRSAAASGQAVYPVGGGTMLDYGLPPTKPGIAVDLRGLDRVIDYPARDMTITVEAGITIAKLSEVLRAEGQHLPVDVPFPERATLGGAMATNASGPRRFGYGTLRDYVIGISVVNDLGQTVKGGGRVVKNVAGYDLMKLYTGSLGTLGIIAQVTLKVKPLPELARWVKISCEPSDILEVLMVLTATRTRPRAVTVRGRGRGGHVVGCSLTVGFEDNALAVEWQMARLREELPARLREQVQEHTSRECDSLLAALRDFPLVVENALTFKANVLPARTVNFVERAAAGELAFHAHAGNGIIVGHLAESSVDVARTRLDDLGRFAGDCAGNVVVLRCPSEWKSVVPVWGRPTPDRVLMRAVKNKLDPHRLFNPGRFVDGI
jgi:glycolate oxidase FAD binding subunit